MSDMEIEVKKLNMAQVISTYRHFLVKDFPEDEQRPLIGMLKGMVMGNYECLGAFENGEMRGYAFFIKHENDYLWDYLATCKEIRNKGLGTAFLKKIMEYYKDADSVIGEVEDPDSTDDDAEKKLRQRRLDFYLRNGVIDTNVRACTFGVRFLILQAAGKPQKRERTENIYFRHYRLYYSKKKCQKSIKILQEEK